MRLDFLEAALGVAQQLNLLPPGVSADPLRDIRRPRRRRAANLTC